MSGTHPSPARTQDERSPGLPGRAATAVCAALLALVHTASGYFLSVAYMSGVADPWERDAAIHSGIASSLALIVSAVAALLTRMFTRAGRLRRWWYVLPALTAAAALLRLTVLAPEA